jgi:hypothetical protein
MFHSLQQYYMIMLDLFSLNNPQFVLNITW